MKKFLALALALTMSLSLVACGKKETPNVSTPGSTIDVLVTQRGVAVNPAREDLRERFTQAGLPVCDIQELKRRAEAICGTPKPVQHGDKVVANIIYRDGTLLDQLYSVKE